MYYKIENKECEVYKKLKAVREKEYALELENQRTVENLLNGHGLKYQDFFGVCGQQNSNRLTSYIGFVFTNPEKVNPEFWVRHTKLSQIFIPNYKTPQGKSVKKVLKNLHKSHFTDVYLILYPDFKNVFQYPFLEVCGDTILLWVEDRFKNDNATQITKTEFEKIMKDAKK